MKKYLLSTIFVLPLYVSCLSAPLYMEERGVILEKYISERLALAYKLHDLLDNRYRAGIASFGDLDAANFEMTYLEAVTNAINIKEPRLFTIVINGLSGRYNILLGVDPVLTRRQIEKTREIYAAHSRDVILSYESGIRSELDVIRIKRIMVDLDFLYHVFVTEKFDL